MQGKRMEVIQTRKQVDRVLDMDQLSTLSKEELIAKIKSLQSHNFQLKNVIAKSVTRKAEKKLKKLQKPFDFTTCRFRHVLLKFLYLGWDYQGYVTQEDTANTIEHCLFEALIKTCLIKDRSSSNYHRCGRTDKGVSSFGQVISIRLRSKLPADKQDDFSNEINYCSVLNKVLPDAIQCIAWCPVNDDFSARFDCKCRVYKYFFPRGSLNIEKMQTASEYLLGIHDFRNFCKMDVGNGVIKFDRNILAVDISPCNQLRVSEEYNMHVITIKGQAFLWHQIRCIMGVLFLVGEGREKPEIVKELLDIEKNPRKPDYNMANELPLNLYLCEYSMGTEWIIDSETLHLVIRKLQTVWTFSSVKSTMLEHMLHDLHTLQKKHSHTTVDKSNNYTLCLLNGVKSKKYIPLLQRQKCESLEDRIERYVKKRKLEVLNS